MTNGEKLLEIFPNIREDYINEDRHDHLSFCPRAYDKNIVCPMDLSDDPELFSCVECTKEFWSKEYSGK